ncbi:MAG: non-canonical purine NTP diphosphatase [Bacteroidales bacterium]|nr:non-canonical purine NTP diphosphatase [Bacteroidales bacterium]
MNKLVFATNNRYKIAEIQHIIGNQLQLLSLKDIQFEGDIPETSPTLEGNAIQKANFIHDRYLLDCFADDTGLEVEALNGAPGVYSARYAGENATYADNVNKLLREMHGLKNRRACFKTVIALFWEGQLYRFEGKICGNITTESSGESGFGYDPIFLPDGYQQTFAEMDASVKNKISHRAIATQKLISFIRSVSD